MVDEVADKCVSLKKGRLDYFICGSDVDHNVTHYVNEQTLRLSSELDSSWVQHPFCVHEHDVLWDLAQHEVQFSLHIQGHETRNKKVSLSSSLFENNSQVCLHVLDQLVKLGFTGEVSYDAPKLAADSLTITATNLPNLHA